MGRYLSQTKMPSDFSEVKFRYRLTCHPNTLQKKTKQTNKQTYELEERSYYITPDPPAAQFGKELCRECNIRLQVLASR
jgi:hypothetical protein